MGVGIGAPRLALADSKEAATPPPPTSAGDSLIGGGSYRWLIYFVILEISCQLMLAVGGGERTLRITIRIIAIGSGLAFIFLVPKGGRRLTVVPWLIASLIVLVLGLFHPDTEGALSGLAQVALYASVMSPVIWVPRLRINPANLERTLLIVWGFHFASTVIGILQVLFPGSFDTALSSSVAALGEVQLEGLSITLDNGVRIFRPMGLTDIPGAASVSGVYAIIFGAAFLARGHRLLAKSLFALSMLAGVAVIALSQVRAMAFVVAIALVVLGILLVRAGQVRKLTLISVTIGFAIAAGSAAALAVAARQVESRFDALLTERPEDVYQSNRGIFLEKTFTDYVPQYPLGAGLGRWGMMNYYFGDEDHRTDPLYAEIQVTAWIFDGGLPLLGAYVGLLLATLAAIFPLTLRSGDPQLRDWAIFILSYDVGIVALIFSYPLFVGQLGLEFWLFNAALLTAAAGIVPASQTARKVRFAPGSATVVAAGRGRERVPVGADPRTPP